MFIILHNAERNFVLLCDSHTLLIKAATLTTLTFVFYGCKTWVSHMNVNSKGFRKHSVEDVWVYDEQGNRGMEKTVHWEASQYVVCTKHY